MSDQFVAEIRIFPFNFPPTGWAFCDGQLLPLSQNTALFSLLGTTYGGNGKSNFALPDLQGNSAKHPGQGPGLSLYDLGQQGGSETVTLLESEIPFHAHQFGGAVSANGDALEPTGNIWAQAAAGRNGSLNQFNVAATGHLNSNCMLPAGGDFPHNNLQPYITLNFCIALQGIFPQRP